MTTALLKRLQDPTRPVELLPVVALVPYEIPAGMRLEGLKDGEWQTIGENRTDAPAVIEVRFPEDASEKERGHFMLRLAWL